jgi:hypothetical protein
MGRKQIQIVAETTTDGPAVITAGPVALIGRSVDVKQGYKSSSVLVGEVVTPGKPLQEESLFDQLLTGEISERERMVLSNPVLLEALRRGIQEAAEGKVVQHPAGFYEITGGGALEGFRTTTEVPIGGEGGPLEHNEWLDAEVQAWLEDEILPGRAPIPGRSYDQTADDAVRESVEVAW